ncbi:MAG: aspartate aminotransferase family protein, partial [Acidimicrobiales bacterium]
DVGSINIVTEIPGPRSRALAARASGSVARPVRPADDIFIAAGQGVVVTDVDGNRYLDSTGGLGCLVVGHAHPRVVDAVRAQAARYLHTDFSVVAYEGYLGLAERISEACGGNWRVALFNSGAEAVENAVKVARYVTGRPGILCFEGAFHGRTHMTLSLTAQEIPYKKGFGPFSPDVYRVPYPGLSGSTLEDFERSAEATFSLFPIAAAIVEPVLGEGGFVIPPPEFLPRLLEMCRKAGALLIVDEIQSGCGRTGAFLACQHSFRAGTRPDLVVLAKSLAAGLPLSALVGDPEIMDVPAPQSLGGTYVGNPVCCAAGLAVLEAIEEERLLERARRIGEVLSEGWRRLARQSGLVREVRGLGAMVGVEFPGGRALAAFLAEARRRGVLAASAGGYRSVLRHLLPLVATDGQVEEVLAVFEATLLGVTSG